MRRMRPESTALGLRPERWPSAYTCCCTAADCSRNFDVARASKPFSFANREIGEKLRGIGRKAAGAAKAAGATKAAPPAKAAGILLTGPEGLKLDGAGADEDEEGAPPKRRMRLESTADGFRPVIGPSAIKASWMYTGCSKKHSRAVSSKPLLAENSDKRNSKGSSSTSIGACRFLRPSSGRSGAPPAKSRLILLASTADGFLPVRGPSSMTAR
mmetsp:Transcript_59993/g.152256  ORF Transcript_59993/g.152256 Transcript_59993/m.152256 type:complete len:214 (-) Transcript_59993:1206-1847(-)